MTQEAQAIELDEDLTCINPNTRLQNYKSFAQKFGDECANKAILAAEANPSGLPIDEATKKMILLTRDFIFGTDMPANPDSVLKNELKDFASTQVAAWQSWCDTMMEYAQGNSKCLPEPKAAPSPARK